MSIQSFRNVVWKHYRTQGRHDLPWRKTKNPYRILVSEIMLQQTQVERVKPFYRAFLKKFPTVEVLAAAPLAHVLLVWQGLGYNRRAKMLHEAAKEIVKTHTGKFPTSVEALQELRGVGSYTARAIAAFAYNQDVVFIETNVRTAVTHCFFDDKKQVSDKEILEVLGKTLPAGKSREWYSALMDYGAHLKRSGVRINAKSKTYMKQSAFEGSARQARGIILKELAVRRRKEDFLIELLGSTRRAQLRLQLAALTKDGLIELKRGVYQLPS